MSKELDVAGAEALQQQMADVAAERALLGAMMVNARNCDEAMEFIASSDMFLHTHSSIFTAILELWAQEKPTSPIAVARLLDEGKDLERCGGLPYLNTLTDEALRNPGSAVYHARIVKDWARRRKAHESLLRGVYHTRDLSKPVDAVLDAAQRDIADASAGVATADSVVRVSDFSDDELAHLERVAAGEVPHGISTGLGQVDKLLGGFLPGQLIIPAGRPSMGKSTLGLGFGVASARKGLPTLVNTLEMSKQELLWRLWSRVGEVDLNKFTSGRLDSYDFAKVREAKKVIDEWPLHIDDQSKTMEAIRASARRFYQRQGALAIWVVDYLQRIRSSVKFDRRDLEVGSWAREFKTLGGELGAAVVLPAQLNREATRRQDKRPELSDMRDSGEIEQEADVVILLHREDYYDPETERAGEADLIFAKNRNGPKDTITVAAQLHFARFTDWTNEEDYR